MSPHMRGVIRGVIHIDGVYLENHLDLPPTGMRAIEITTGTVNAIAVLRVLHIALHQ